MNAINNLCITGVKYNNTIFTGLKKENPKMQNKEEQTEFVIGVVLEAMAKRIEYEVPENGKFNKLSVSCNVPETSNKAMLAIECDALEPKNSRRLSVGVRRKTSDRVISNYILKGTKKEILDYVKNPDNREEIIKTVNNLSESVDNYYRENF